MAEALPSKPSRKATPPLDTTFFELCRLADYPNRIPVKRYFEDHYGIDPFAGGHRMEEIFNYIYSDAFSKNTPPGCLEAYWSLLRLYAHAIAQTTNSLEGKSRYGVGALVRHLWKPTAYPNLSFITFNQDLLIEKAIETTKSLASYRSVYWDITQTYGVDFDSYISTSRSSRPFWASCLHSIKVLKLHGSLNWFYKVRSGQDPKNAIRDPKSQLICLNHQEILSNLRLMSPMKAIDLIPLVVPPIYEKASRYQKAIGPIWEKAEQEIAESTKLIIFGYSFPDTDFAARTLFRRCFYKNRSLQEIDVIDTDPKVAAKIAGLLDVKKFKYYRDVHKYTHDA
ncbi:MAG: SIR2 family protein [Proteobacteria bacterium]|nr:SIR2 family protein [Pseudomonadota bacterium]